MESLGENPLPRTPNEAFGDLRLFEGTWFPKLLVLMYGFILIMITDILFNFPGAQFVPGERIGFDCLINPDCFGWWIWRYFILVGIIIGILVSFAALCLIVQTQGSKLFSAPATSNRKYRRLQKSQQELLKNVVWALAICSLLAGFTAYDWISITETFTI